MKKIYIFIAYLFFGLMVHDTLQAQCVPEDCLSDLPPFGGVCDTVVVTGRVNEPYSDFISFHITSECTQASVLDPTQSGSFRITLMHSFSFDDLPDGIDIVTNAPSYSPPANGCAAATGIPTQAGVFDAKVNFLLNVTFFLTTNCSFIGIPQSNNAISESIQMVILPDPNFTGLESGSYCVTDAPLMLTATGTQGGIFSGPGVDGNVFNPTIAGPGVHTITYVVSAQEGAAVAPATDSFSVTVIVEGSLENVEASICEGQSYTLPDGSVVTEPGTYESIEASGPACPTIVITELEVLSNSAFQLIESICEGESYLFPDGSLGTESGVYDFILTNEVGCDSLLTIELNLLPASDILIEAQICEGQTYTLPDGSITAEAGLYPFTFISSVGCDSIVNVQLDVVPSIFIEQSVEICEGQTYILPDGNEVSEGGIYELSLTDEDGCETNYEIELLIHPTSVTNVGAVICAGGTFSFPDGSQANLPGTYEILHSTAQGCDSLLVYDLQQQGIDTITLNAMICQGDFFVLSNGDTVFVAGSYEIIDSSTAPCPTLLLTELLVISADSTLLNVALCEDEVYVLPDSTETSQPGLYVFELNTANGCDSVVMIQITVDSLKIIEEFVSICEGDSYTLPDGSEVNQPGLYETLVTDSTTCATLILTELTIIITARDTVEDRFCQQGIYIFPDSSFTAEPGITTIELVGDEGCPLLQTFLLSHSNEIGFTFEVAEASVIFSNQSTVGTFEWDFGDGNNSFDRDPTHQYDQSGVYEVCLTMTDSCGTLLLCRDVEIVLTSLQGARPNEWAMFPNPIHNELFLERRGETQPQRLDIQLLSLSGKLLQHQQVSWNGLESIVIDTKTLPSGLYVLRIYEHDTWYHLKVVKQ